MAEDEYFSRGAYLAPGIRFRKSGNRKDHRTAAKGYRRDIDGLRAVAVIPVLLFHFGVSQIPGGFAGVDVFFVISGYLIAGSLLSDLQAGQFSILDFYWRRFRRIMPALVVTLLGSTIAAWMFVPADQFKEFAWSLLASATFWSNIYFWVVIDYFATSADLTPLLHTWSLAVEEQYYLFAPIVMYLVHRFLHARWFWVLAPLMLASFALSVYGMQVGPRFTFYWIPTRAWELMLGAMLILCPLPRVSRPLVVEAIGLVGLAALGWSYVTLTEGSVFPAQGAVLPCIGAALLIYAGEPHDTGRRPAVSRLLELPPLVWIGLISYSLYLVHWPLVSFATHRTLQPVNAPIAFMAASLLLAWAMWRWVEQPFRNSPRLRGRRQIFAASTAAIGLCAMVAGVILGNDGFRGRDADFPRREVEWTNWKKGVCFLGEGSDIENFSITECTHDLGFDEAKILLWGDSFAAQYVSGLPANASRLGSNVVQMTYAGCPPLLDYRSAGMPDCAPFNRKSLGLATSGSFSTVILSALWDVHRLSSLQGLGDTLEILREAGLRVVVISQSPRFIDDVQRISSHALKSGGDPWNFRVEISEPIRDLLREETESHGQQFVEPISLLCAEDVCPLADDVDFYAFDAAHMTTRGASLALSSYLDAFLPEGETLLGWSRRDEQRDP